MLKLLDQTVELNEQDEILNRLKGMKVSGLKQGIEKQTGYPISREDDLCV